MNSYSELSKMLSSSEIVDFNAHGIDVKYQGDLVIYSTKKEVCESGCELTELQNECNGVIISKETGGIVAGCQKKFYKLLNQEHFEELCKKHDGQTPEFEYCEDGTVIRLYNYKNEWKTATTRCIDAKNSYWSSNKTFDEMFFSIFDSSDLNILDKSFTYIFILLSPENRIVVEHKKSELVFVCKIKNEYNEANYYSDYLLSKKYDSVKRIIPKENEFLELESLFDYSKKGIIVIFGDKYYQYNFKFYDFVKDIRGNVPRIKDRYIELINDAYYKNLLRVYFEEHTSVFDSVENSIEMVVKQIHSLYIKSHVKHNIKIMPAHKYYRTLIQLHATYKKMGHVITENIVEQKVKSLPFKILKRFIESTFYI